MIITFKQAMESLGDRMQKQMAETFWSIERIRPMNKKQLETFQGKGAKKKLVLQKLLAEYEERQDNLRVIKNILTGLK